MSKRQKPIYETSQNYIWSILDNFDDRYKKRVWRYLYRSIRRLRKQ